jgi:hypothetical protein
MNENLIAHNQNQQSEPSADNKLSRRLRLLAKTGIGFLLLIAALALPSLPAFSDSKPRAVTIQKEEKAKEIDLVPAVKNKQFREGLNHVYTGPEGLKLSARVKGDKIADWVVTDKNGKELPATYSKAVRYCRICVTVGGVRVCLIVPCKGTIIVIVRGGTKQA